MRVVIAGASGFVGRAVSTALRGHGHEVQRLVRHPAKVPEEFEWDPRHGRLASAALDGCDAILNLTGENIAGGRWTKARQHVILGSRIDATATLIATMRQLRTPPRILLNASAVGYYGDQGDSELSEASPPGRGFLADVCSAWEAEAWRAQDLGIRVVLLRLGVVLAPDGGALAKMLPVFRLGLGGRLGGGRQWMSWVHRDDVVGVIEDALTDSRYAGPLNVVSPQPVRNREFTATLGRAVHRPTLFPAPAPLLRLALGQMADETLLASTRAVPARLQELGYAFRVGSLDSALRLGDGG